MSAWTVERRARQAEAIRRWRPWEHSTGPRTPEGKARSSRNAYSKVWGLWTRDRKGRFRRLPVKGHEWLYMAVLKWRQHQEAGPVHGPQASKVNATTGVNDGPPALDA